LAADNLGKPTPQGLNSLLAQSTGKLWSCKDLANIWAIYKLGQLKGVKLQANTKMSQVKKLAVFLKTKKIMQ